MSVESCINLTHTRRRLPVHLVNLGHAAQTLLSPAWLWSSYVIGQTIIFLACGFYLSFFLLF